MVRIVWLRDEDLVRGRGDYLSVGLKFALWFLVAVFFTVVVLGVLYFSYSSLFQQFIVALMVGFLSAETLVWIAIRPTMRERLVQIWENSLKPIRDSAEKPFQFYGFLNDYSQRELERKTDSLAKYGKYGPFRLYPKKLLQNKLVARLNEHGRKFNERLDQLVAVAKARGVELKLNYAFPHWGFKHIREDLNPTLSGGERQVQDDCLAEMDRTHRDEVAKLKEYHEGVVVIAEGIIRILDSFGGKNGINVGKPSSS